jgi:hypothetical protein
MRVVRALMVAGVFAAVAGACAGNGATGTNQPTAGQTAITNPGASTAPSTAADTTHGYPYPVSGAFVGTFRAVINCPAIVPDDRSPWPSGWTPHLHELVLPPGWSAQANPYRLIRPDGSLAATEGDIIRVMGTIPGPTSSFCSFGRELDVTSIEVVTGS